jgi:hypothetical protein
MKEIPLTKGKVALVDDENFEWLNQWKWCVSINGYAIRRKLKSVKCIHMHREIIKTPAGMDTDHINGNRLDNRLINLRICNTPENQHNSKLRKSNTSGYKGVSWHQQNKKWLAQITNNYKNTYLGCFDTPEKAAHAYDKAAKELFGEFARLNFKEKFNGGKSDHQGY